ncbi:MAG: peptidylprolyl isomerase [Nitrospirota bacterium]
MKKNLFAVIAMVGILFANAIPGSASGSVVVDRVVAVVNDEIITLSDLQREEALKKGEAARDDRLVLEDMIDRKLQMAAAKRAGVDVTDKELDEAVADIIKRNNMDMLQFGMALGKEGLTLEQYRAELREQITLSRLFNKYVRSNVNVDEAEAREFYQNNPKTYSLPEEIRVRQIFLALPDKATPEQAAAVREKAQAVYARAQKGEDFIHLVREVSQGATASEDGDLGFMRRGDALSEIEEAARALKPGDSSSPFLCAGGYNIIKLEELRTTVKPFEKVKDEIMKKLYEQKMENTYRSWLQALRGDSHIENRL